MPWVTSTRKFSTCSSTNTFHVAKTEIKLTLIPERLRGEMAAFDIKAGKKVVVEEGRRITARTFASWKSRRQELEVPDDYLFGKVWPRTSSTRRPAKSGCSANDEITEEVLEQLREAGIKEIDTLYTNDLDRGPFISIRCASTPTRNELEALVEIYRMMRPGEPPTKDAAENLFQNLFFSADRYDLSAVGRMKFNRRVGRDEVTGQGMLRTEDIVDV